jgi:uncharacterized protein
MTFLEPAAAAPSWLLVDSYLPGGFRIGGVVRAGPVIVWPNGVTPWAPADDRAFEAADFDAVAAIRPAIDVLIVGCGRRTRLLPSAIRVHLKASGIGVDAMATDAACRTYNVLVTEMRRVAAALLPL